MTYPTLAQIEARLEMERITFDWSILNDPDLDPDEAYDIAVYLAKRIAEENCPEEDWSIFDFNPADEQD